MTHPGDMSPAEFFELPVVPFPEAASCLQDLVSSSQPTGFVDERGMVWVWCVRGNGTHGRKMLS